MLMNYKRESLAISANVRRVEEFAKDNQYAPLVVIGTRST